MLKGKAHIYLCPPLQHKRSFRKKETDDRERERQREKVSLRRGSRWVGRQLPLEMGGLCSFDSPTIPFIASFVSITEIHHCQVLLLLLSLSLAFLLAPLLFSCLNRLR